MTRALLERRQPRALLVVGAKDTGKSTLVEELLTGWLSSEPVAVVDCDIGQSRLGPPTTVGWGIVEPGFRGWQHVPVRGTAFTGAVSPEGNVDTFLDAAARMVQAARHTGHRLLIDTTGLVDGELGRALKARKIELVKPDLVLAIQQDHELEDLLTALPDDIPIERLVASSAVVPRNLDARAAYRGRQFARYFINAAKQSFALDRVKLVGLGPDWAAHAEIPRSIDALDDRVAGLRSRTGEDLALGLVRAVDPVKHTITLLTPLETPAAIATIAIGSVKWPEQPSPAA